MEVWKDIENYEGLYQISNLGRVKSLYRLRTKSNGSTIPVKEIIKKPGETHDGYQIIGLNSEEKMHTYRVHRLVAKSFIPNPDNKPQVNHINGIKTDNRDQNLEWVTQSENMKHAYETGIRKSRKGENNWSHKSPYRKLSDEKIMEIEEMLERGDTQKTIAKRFDVTQESISRIKLKKTKFQKKMLENNGIGSQ